MEHPLDSQHMLTSIDLLSQQVSHAWTATRSIVVPEQFGQINKVVLFGMGGSALGFDVLRHLYAAQVKVPLLIENGYTIPQYVDGNTLVILSSYSGTTEETITVAKTMAERTDKIMVITTGGDLRTMAVAQGWPCYVIEPKYNPCGQPRIAVGYATIGVLALLQHAGIVTVTDNDIEAVVHYLDGNRELLRDAAAEAVMALQQKIIVYVASEHLCGNVHVVANQTNENGKQFAVGFSLPELNHHLLEGLQFPQNNQTNLHFVLLESLLYHPRNQKRYEVMKQVLAQQHIGSSSFVVTAPTALLQVFEVMQWGSYLSFYLAQANQTDPSPIPWVDYFKNALQH